ncbi:GTP-binding protein TrmE N-terminus-domain-containing protein [Lineolata rhizophorae]|uniref:GTP-binding protein TrmE N-terminus-domain-containing protein n=1 Tax=Lineolata rhizophorae TaxID=578093 RepID=A0A6A6PF84_9PEZI|nr:GTP-binding protein TrmE N-terminus-domain-containing protein [Lineolata rhizophorae]
MDLRSRALDASKTLLYASSRLCCPCCRVLGLDRPRRAFSASRVPLRAAGALPAASSHARFVPLLLSGRRYDARRRGAPSPSQRCAGTYAMSDADSTIYALSTAPGRAAIAVIRISGPACADIYRSLCPYQPFPKARYAALRTLYDPSAPPSSPPSKDGILDFSALVLFLPSPRTVTGEDVLELHVHGGPAVVKAVLSAIPRCRTSQPTPAHRIRYAEPGEFTRRAFAHGRLDVTQIEALGDTLAASTEMQRRVATRGMSSIGGQGALAARYEAWRAALLRARAELEALIDFAEDQHFDESPVQLAGSVAGQVRALRRAVDAHAANAVRGEMLRSGIGVALLGAPNVGKSSLLNRVVGREAAIVSKEAGTTRDVVEVGIDIGGWYCKLGDMAGLRRAVARVEAEAGVQDTMPGPPMAGASGQNVRGLDRVLDSMVGEVEQEGIKRAKQRALASDVVIVVLCLHREASSGEIRLDIDPEVAETARRCIVEKQNVVVAVNKMDLVPDYPSGPEGIRAFKAHLQKQIGDVLSPLPPEKVFTVSCKAASEPEIGRSTCDAGNIQQFLQGLVGVFRDITCPLVLDVADSDTAGADPSVWQESLSATERHRLLLEDCSAHLRDFLTAVGGEHEDGFACGDVDADIDIVLAAESLRGAADCLARITGMGEAGDVEEVLGVVFEKFCVGK